MSRMIFYQLASQVSKEYRIVFTGHRSWSTLQASDLFAENYIHYCPLDRLYSEYSLTLGGEGTQIVLSCIDGLFYCIFMLLCKKHPG